MVKFLKPAKKDPDTEKPVEAPVEPVVAKQVSIPARPHPTGTEDDWT